MKQQQTLTTAPTKSTCTLCGRTNKPTPNLICSKCEHHLTRNINQITNLWTEAHNCLQPHKGTGGSNTGEPTLGINLTALDFISGREILNVFHGWETVIRAGRHLTPPALLPTQPDLKTTIEKTVQFHLTHMQWTITQTWADEYAKEIISLHHKGTAAAQQFIDPVSRISCPTPTNNKACGQSLTVNDTDLLSVVPCRKCGTQWTVARLIAVGATNTDATTWVDAESIATWLGISSGQVRRIARKHSIQRKGLLLNMQQLISVYKK